VRLLLLFCFSAICVTTLALSVASILFPATALAEKLTGFEIPDFNPDGSRKSLLKAGVAVIDNKRGTIDISELKLLFYKKGGDPRKPEVEMTVQSPKCLYSPELKRATSDEAVEIDRENLHVTGIGFEWQDNEAKQEFIIRSKAKVVLNNMGNKLNETKPAETR
jgi:hypothetical protein